MSKRAKKRTKKAERPWKPKVDDTVKMTGTVLEIDTKVGEVLVRIHDDKYPRWFDVKALHPHTVRATAEGKPEKKASRMTDAQLAKAYRESARRTNEIMNEHKNRRAKKVAKKVGGISSTTLRIAKSVAKRIAVLKATQPTKQQPTKGAKKK